MKKIATLLAFFVGIAVNAQSVTNTSTGNLALDNQNTGNGNGWMNSAFGYLSLKVTHDGSWNSGFGASALYKNTNGDNNTALGGDAMYNNTTGSYNTASGDGTLYYNLTGANNTAIGSHALYKNVTDNNTAVGYYSLYNNTSGGSNTASGYQALYNNTTGSYNTGLGYNARASSASAANQTVIGYNADGQENNSVTLGNSDVTKVFMAEDAGATVYAAGLNLNSFLITATSTILTLSGDLTINSDERLKDNIQPLGSTLNKLHQIEAKTYSFKKDEEHTPKIGVLAQEVQAVFPELVTEGADGILSVNYQGLVPVLINAINEQEVKMSEQDVKMSEQDVKMSEQDAKIAALEAQNEQLAIASQKIAALEEMVRFLAVQQSQTTSSVAAN